jgi:hypothetical protein
MKLKKSVRTIRVLWLWTHDPWVGNRCSIWLSSQCCRFHGDSVGLGSQPLDAVIMSCVSWCRISHGTACQVIEHDAAVQFFPFVMLWWLCGIVLHYEFFCVGKQLLSLFLCDYLYLSLSWLSNNSLGCCLLQLVITQFDCFPTVLANYSTLAMLQSNHVLVMLRSTQFCCCFQTTVIWQP